LEHPDKEGGAAGFPLPRSPALRDYSACGGRHIRFDNHGNRRARQQKDAGAILPRPHGSEAQRDGNPSREHQNGRLRHKSRHKCRGCEHTTHLSYREIWWTWSGSNRRPLPCHGSALPAAPQAHVRSDVRGGLKQLNSRLPAIDSQTRWWRSASLLPCKFCESWET
jgi:hypothetical protein